MTKYIELEALKNRFAKRLVWLKKDIHDEYSLGLHDGCEYDTKLIDEIPAADVAPVVHGRWIMHDDEFGLTCECSACHIETMGDGNYCPNCGAKMDEGRLMKQDMSKTCGFGYQAMWVKRDSGEISEKEFIQWYDEHCANCLYMNEICMLGEVE